jgi:DNA helicase HerA-like ATPase
MGTFIVHRLINARDKEAIENGCSTANRNSLAFLPILGEGEAILMGVDFPMPVLLKINAPTIKPKSDTPRFRKQLLKAPILKDETSIIVKEVIENTDKDN